MAGNEGRRTRRRAEWDNSLSDLSVYRLTNSELKRKSQLFKSKNLDAAKREMYRQTCTSLLTTPTRSQKSQCGKDSYATLEELLYRADQSLNTAQGLCSPKLYSVDPVITVAPHIQQQEIGELNGCGTEWAESPKVLSSIHHQSPVAPPTPEEQQSPVVAKQQLVQSIEEVKQANQMLLDTVYEQQNIIDTLAHDVLVMKQKYDELYSIMTTIMQQMPRPPPIINPLMDHRQNNEQLNSSYVPLPLYKLNEH